jgi:predicted DNA-binding transcriptional regulator AlpA
MVSASSDLQDRPRGRLSDRRMPAPVLPEALGLRGFEAAALVPVSRMTWLRWDARQLCPAPVRIGKTVRWRREELLAWIKEGCPCRREWELRHPEYRLAGDGQVDNTQAEGGAA